MSTDYNAQHRVSIRGGSLGTLTGVSLGRDVRRVLEELNTYGYRVAFVIEDSPNVFWHLGQILLAVVTLGSYYRKAGLLIIGERLPDIQGDLKGAIASLREEDELRRAALDLLNE